MSPAEKDRAIIEATLPGNTSLTHFTDFRSSHEDLARLLAAVRQEAYKEGWNDREDDLIAGVNRIAPEEASQGAGEPVGLDAYDAGLLGDGGGGDVGWWHDYLRAELERAHEFYASQVTSPPTDPRTKALEEALETARDALQAAYQRTGHADDLAGAHIADAALSPVQAVKGDDHG